jgi:hypothetical protein
MPVLVLAVTTLVSFILVVTEVGCAEELSHFLATATRAHTSSKSLGETCLVGLRIVEARGRANNLSPNREIVSDLSDVRTQLAPLPFLHFQTLARAQREIKVGVSGTFSANGAANERLQLTVIPEEILPKEKKVRYLVNWQGERGEELLSTDLKVQNGKSIVLVADSASSANDSTVLCLNVTCR